MTRLGLIAGNGKFPFLVLDAARAQGFDVVVAAIKEETSPEIESKGAASVYWLSLGELSKLIDTFKAAGVTRAVMAGQVKHKQIFSAIKPDWRLAKLLLSLGTRNTDSLLGAIAKVLADEGIVLESSTALLEPVIAEAACVAVEAMEGTDATIERAGEIMRSLGSDAGAANDPTLRKEKDREEWGSRLLSRALTVVKVAKPGQDMRFDVPVIGVKTIEIMVRAGASCLAVDAGRCLLLDGEAVTRAADDGGLAICAE